MLNTAHFMGGIYPGLLKQLFGSDSGSKGVLIYADESRTALCLCVEAHQH